MASAKKTPSRSAKKAKSQNSEEESDHKDDGSSSEDEPLVKKAKSLEPPTVSIYIHFNFGGVLFIASQLDVFFLFNLIRFLYFSRMKKSKYSLKVF